MKRFSILVALILAITFVVGRIDLSSNDIVKEVLNDEDVWYNPNDKDQNVASEKDCSANAGIRLVSDTNISEEREKYGTDNKANLRELYYKDGYIYFKYIIAKGDTINVGGVSYVQTNKVKIETKLIKTNPIFEQRTEEDYTYNDGDPYCSSATFSIEKFNEDFGRVYVGELSEEDAKRYNGITAKVTMYYDSSDKLHDGLSMTRSVEYSIDNFKID